MSYATQADMEARFGHEELVQLTDREATGDIDTAVLGAALADADDEIDGYLMGRYTLPLAVVPGRLKTIACDIARYRLFDDQVPEAIASRYEQAVRFLRDVGTGRLNLGLDGSDQAATPAGGAQHDGPERMFSMDTLEDF